MSDLDLQNWTKAQLTSLFTSDDASFDDAFEATFGRDVSISREGDSSSSSSSSSRDELKEHYRAQRAAMTKVDITWGDVEVVSKDSNNPDEAGTVTGSFTITRSLHFRLRAGPMQTQNVVSFKAIVEQDQTAVEGPDKRRIVLFEDNEKVEPPPGRADLFKKPEQHD